MTKLENLFSASTILKRFQETDIENLKKKYGDFHDVNAKYLEDIGFRKNLDKIIRPLLNAYKNVQLSVDGDCSYGAIIKEKQLSDRVHLHFDLAHTLKNVVKHVTNFLTKHNHHGDSEGKIGNVNKFRLVNYIKNTMINITKIFQETKDKNDAKILVDDAWQTMKDHCLGIHDNCEMNGMNCGEEPVFRTYNKKFDQSQLDELVSDIFDNWLLSDDLYKKLENFGNTSNLESFHSIFTNRNLWTKTGSLHVATPKFEGITAIASTIYNFGDKEAARKVMNLVGWTVLEGNLESLDKAEKERDTARASKIRRKAISKLNRVRKQKQYQNSTKWRKLNPYIPSTQSSKALVGISK